MANKIVSGSNTNANAIAKGLKESPDSLFFCSPEQIYSPVKIRREPVETTGGKYTEFSKPKGGAGGNFDAGHVGPTSKELNPYFALGVNTDFQMVAHDDEVRELSITRKEHNKIEHVRTTAFRGPMMLSGFGYDLCDQPVPAGPNGKVDPDAAKDRTKFKSGPIDLKWDDERGVWAGGPQIVEGVLLSNISAPSSTNNPTTFTVGLRRDAGWVNNGEIITCTNRDKSLEVSQGSSSDILVIAIRINYEWRPLWVGCEQ